VTARRKLLISRTSLVLVLAVAWACTNAQNDPATGHATATDTTNLSQMPDTSTASSFYQISTNLGDMVVELYNNTPEHRDNFSRLVDEGFYDGTSFHRVIAGFMIQGGDPNSKNDDPMDDGAGGPGYTLPAELNAGHYHQRGALAAARQGDSVNPTRASSGSQFYIVLGGSPFDAATLDQIERSLRTQIPDPAFAFSDSARADYMSDGGAPHLDGSYTIFGQVVEGFEVLDSIGSSATARSSGQAVHPNLADQPFDKVTMQIRRLDDYSPPES
jgi:peptidyl-prolyl cis-trans isomerase B (cyclophilin B)